jgi:hypothetical protein
MLVLKNSRTSLFTIIHSNLKQKKKKPNKTKHKNMKILLILILTTTKQTLMKKYI